MISSEGKNVRKVALYLLERDVKGRHDPAFEWRLGQEVIFSIIEFEIDYLTHFIGILPTQGIEDTKKSSIRLHFCAFGLGRIVLHIISTFILGSAALLSKYMSFTCVATSGACLGESSSLGGCF